MNTHSTATHPREVFYWCRACQQDVEPSTFTGDETSPCPFCGSFDLQTERNPSFLMLILGACVALVLLGLLILAVALAAQWASQALAVVIDVV